MRCDLHVHTALSACAENIMSPRKVVEEAFACGIELLAITDHNASVHVATVIRWATPLGITVLPALELASREEVHVLAYFPDLEALADFQAQVDASLPPLPNDSEGFGAQVIYDDQDEICGLDGQIRQVGTSLSLTHWVRNIHALDGLAIPAHIDRPRHGLIAQLGLIDPQGRYDALELRRQTWKQQRHLAGDRLENFPLISGSDAHFLEDVGRGMIELPLRSASLTSLRDGLRQTA